MDNSWNLHWECVLWTGEKKGIASRCRVEETPDICYTISLKKDHFADFESEEVLEELRSKFGESTQFVSPPRMR